MESVRIEKRTRREESTRAPAPLLRSNSRGEAVIDGSQRRSGGVGIPFALEAAHSSPPDTFPFPSPFSQSPPILLARLWWSSREIGMFCGRGALSMYSPPSRKSYSCSRLGSCPQRHRSDAPLPVPPPTSHACEAFPIRMRMHVFFDLCMKKVESNAEKEKTNLAPSPRTADPLADE